MVLTSFFSLANGTVREFQGPSALYARANGNKASLGLGLLEKGRYKSSFINILIPVVSDDGLTQAEIASCLNTENIHDSAHHLRKCFLDILRTFIFSKS